jgi:hypothetical protein
VPIPKKEDIINEKYISPIFFIGTDAHCAVAKVGGEMSLKKE